jgi:hypothetical protein
MTDILVWALWATGGVITVALLIYWRHPARQRYQYAGWITLGVMWGAQAWVAHVHHGSSRRVWIYVALAAVSAVAGSVGIISKSRN